ncbi:unnamed protein product [Chilo suppressalis]|uniref:Kazal-like domain-containing protein n=1 Tax=Chilo suppressalis TaxID=168631 RepID=A0ABN8B499_CHISP|nr:hypothetical protein evm_001952 [Chilo suppressalis]CAH0402332.1 unnamed protein product [Chilo suppressalis]
MDIPSIVGAIILLFAVSSESTSIEALLDPPMESKITQKRAVTRRNELVEFIEEKLVQQSQALEYIINIIKKNEGIMEKLVENLSKTMQQPKMPEKIESTRRSFNDTNIVEEDTDKKLNRWCSIGLLCVGSNESVCGYDENYGYGKFDDICHMVRVNCYWKYDFSMVPSCEPTV